MYNTNNDHWKGIDNIIGYFKGKENNQIPYRTTTENKSISFVYDNYATNLGDRRSVTGIVNTIGSMITNWDSKTQTTVSMSSTEAEYIALRKCEQESVFQSNLLNELGETNCYPAEVLEDNSGAIFLMKNKQVSPRTKHIDVRYHFLRDLYEDDKLRVNKVKTKNNVSDGITNNLGLELCTNHTDVLLSVSVQVPRENVE